MADLGFEAEDRPLDQESLRKHLQGVAKLPETAKMLFATVYGWMDG
jgi:hypothetical protein